MAAFPGANLVEKKTVEGAQTLFRGSVARALKPWTEDGDKVVALQSQVWDDGRICTPYIIQCHDGEQVDIFAQLIVTP
jgi:hypothetical protein